MKVALKTATWKETNPEKIKEKYSSFLWKMQIIFAINVIYLGWKEQWIIFAINAYFLLVTTIALETYRKHKQETLK